MRQNNIAGSKTRLLYDLVVAPQRWLPVQLVEQRVQNDIEGNLNAVRACAMERFRYLTTVYLLHGSELSAIPMDVFSCELHRLNPNAYCKLQLTSAGTVEKGEVGEKQSEEIYNANEEPASGFFNSIDQMFRSKN